MLVAENSEERIFGKYRLGSRNPFDGPKVSYSGGGGLCSTADDYFRFCQMVLQKGEYRDRRLLSRMTIEQATRPHLSIPREFFCGDSSDFGLGFAVQRPNGEPRPGSPGTLRWGSIFNGFFFIDPQEEMSVLRLVNCFRAKPSGQRNSCNLYMQPWMTDTHAARINLICRGRRMAILRVRG